MPQRTFWLFYLLAALSSGQVAAQNRDGYTYPFPASHGISGTFGELRGPHFHTGLDIRSAEKTGWPLKAIADGYVWRVSVNTGSYGKAVYVKLNDGRTAVYGHCDGFFKALDDHVYGIQVKNRQFNQELYFKPQDFPVKKGQTIAFSGNTGISAGPHLHFELRDPAERPLNPLAWFKNEFQDPYPPFLTRIALDPLDPNARVYGAFAQHVHTPRKVAPGKYVCPIDVIPVRGRVGFAFTGYDQLKNSTQYCGYYQAELYLDDRLIHGHRFDELRFGEGRYALQHMDAHFLEEEGGYLTRCYRAENNRLPFYYGEVNGGEIVLRDDVKHTLTLKVEDLHGNVTTYSCVIQRDNEPDKLRPVAQRYGAIPRGVEVLHNHLVVLSGAPTNAADTQITAIYPGGKTKLWPMSYSRGQTGVTLIPIGNGEIPIELRHPSWYRGLPVQLDQMLVPGRSATIEVDQHCTVFVPAGAVFDTVYLSISVEKTNNPRYLSGVYRIGNPGDPLFRRINVRLEPDPSKAQRWPAHQRTLLEIRGPNRYNRPYTVGGQASVNSFGAFAILADDTPPKLWPTNFVNGGTINGTAKYLKLAARDDLSEINGYNVQGWFDGRWDVVEYYWYSGDVYYRFRTPPTPGQHTLRIRMSDHAGNILDKTFSFTVK